LAELAVKLGLIDTKVLKNFACGGRGGERPARRPDAEGVPVIVPEREAAALTCADPGADGLGTTVQRSKALLDA
jgi:hypothetical protein